MTPEPPGGRPLAIGLVVAAVTTLQLGAGFAVKLFDDLGPAGTALVRLAFAAAVLWALCGHSRAGTRRATCAWRWRSG